MQLTDPEASIHVLADRAGVGVASIHRYFPNKGAIYAEISRRLHRRFLGQMREVLQHPPGDLPAVVRRVCELAVHEQGVSPALRRCLNVNVPVSWSQDSADDVYVTIVREITAWLAATMPNPPPDLAERTFIAFAAVRGLTVMSMVFPELAPTGDKLVDHMTRGTLTYLLGDSTSPAASGTPPPTTTDM